MKSTSVLLAVAVLILTMVSIQIGASIAKEMFPLVGPEGATTLRLAFATLILGALFRPWRMKLTRTSWISVAVYGVALGCMNLLFYLAIARIPLGIGVALEFTGPLAIAVATSRKAVDFLWAGLAAAGVVLILPATPLSSPLDPVGVAFALGAGACWASYILFGQRAGAQHGMQASALGMAIAAVVVMPVGIIQVGAALLSPQVIPLALAVAVLSSAIPYSLEMYALTRLPTKTFGALMSVEPVIGALAGLVLLGERLTVSQTVAIAAIIAGSVGATFTATRAQPAGILGD